MTPEQREEYIKLQDYFLQREGNVTSKKKIDRLNELGKLSVEYRKMNRLSQALDIQWLV